MTDAADIARAFNGWTPNRKELEIATLRARVAELEAVLAELARLKIHKDAFGKTDEYLRRQPAAWERVRAAVNASATPTPDPRDARIAELTENYDRLAHAYCRVVGIAPDEPISDAGHEAWQLVAHEAAVRGVRHENARIAEVEQAAIQWRLRMAELETEAQESDARIAVLEAALREMVSSFEHAAVDHLGDRPGFQDDALAAARRALGEETSGG